MSQIIYELSTEPLKSLAKPFYRGRGPFYPGMGPDGSPIFSKCRLTLASQVIVSSIALPIILFVGLIETSILVFKREGKLALTRMVDGLKNHLFVFIPKSVYCLFTSDQKTINFLASHYGILCRYSSNIYLSKTPRRGHYSLEEINFNQNERLTDLSMCSTHLTQAPDVSRNSRLEHLNFKRNRLTQSPNVNENPLLTRLNLKYNRLTQSPNVSENPLLTNLNLNGNQLSQSPDVSRNTLLEYLKLSGNRLTQSPDVSGNHCLKTLDLSHNELTRLHDSIITLPRNCIVDAEDNRFSPEYCLQFQARLREQRELDPSRGPTVHMSIHDAAANHNIPESPVTQTSAGMLRAFFAAESAEIQQQGWARIRQQSMALFQQDTERRLRGLANFEPLMPIRGAAVNHNAPARVTLEAELNLWAGGFSAPIDFSPLINLDQENRSILLNYLGKLKHTADYKDLRDPEKKAQKNTIQRVENMLRLACQNPEFRSNLLGLMIEGNASCGDRVILLLNDIEVQWHIYHKEHNTQELADLAIKAQRYDLLKLHGKKEAVRRQLGDELETILAYQIKLTEALQLPISTRTMLYPGMSGVTEEMLNTARHEIGSISKLDLLAQSELWRNFLKKENLPSFTAIEDDFAERMENLDPEAMSDQDYLNACSAFPIAKEAALRQLAKRLTGQLPLQLN